MKNLYYYLLLLSLISTPALSQKKDLKNTAESYFDGIAQFGFSGAVIIGDKEGIIFHKGYGLADKETGREINSGTVFTIASITKLFTALLIKKLASENRLQLEDPISKYFSDVPNDKKGITLEHLLTHSSGLKRNGIDGGDTNLEATRMEVLKNVLKSELLFEPGSRQEYSNIGYTLLAMIAENVANRRYSQFIKFHNASALDSASPLPWKRSGLLRSSG